MLRFELLDFHSAPDETATIRRISALGIHWRVRVETFKGVDGWAGRLVFEPQSPVMRYPPRRGPISLQGATQAEIVAAAHEIDERRLLALFHSLG
ncbi:MAG: hypothetical protein FWJ74_08155 [Gemmatimonadota bacterium]